MKFDDYQNAAHETAIYPDMFSLVVGPLTELGLLGNLSEAPVDKFGKLQRLMRNPYYPALGLSGEVGEYCNKLKKVMRDKAGVITREFREDAFSELGDVLWYLAECASSLGLSLDEIAQANAEKLASRKERGVLQGSGDIR